MSHPILSLEGVRVPLAAFTLEVNVTLPGRLTVLFGPSGAGKTTLLEVVAGLRRPERGRLRLGPRVLEDAAAGLFVPPERRRVGYVPQEGALFPHLPVRANLLYGHRPAAGAGAPPRFTLGAVAATLEIAPLLDRRDVHGLSGGERQRVALGRALLAGPELLLLDEPFAGLDAALKARLWPCLRRVREEFALPILMVTHSPADVMALADDVLILERGRVVAQGSPGTLFEPATEPSYVLKATSPAPAPADSRPEVWS